MKFLGSPLITILITLLFLLLQFRYWRLLHNQATSFKWLLFSLRSFTLLWILFLLLNPWISWNRKETNPQRIPVIFDLSESMWIHLDKMQYNPGVLKDKIDQWKNTHNLNMEYFRLGKQINKLENMDNPNFVTDFSSLPDFLAYDDPNQAILITDGQATVGRELTDLHFKSDIPIHILGVGPLKTGDDLEISQVEIPPFIISTDTVQIKLSLQSTISSTTTSLLRIVNENGDEVYNSPLNFDSGSKQDEIILKIPAQKLTGLNTVYLAPVTDEIQKENNQYSFMVDTREAEERVLLISGALSPNTHLINTLLESLPRVVVDHYYRVDKFNWNEEPLTSFYPLPEMIVLDDFPSEKLDKNMFTKIVELSNSNNIPLIYMEGPKINLSNAELIRSSFPFLLPKPMDSDESVSVSEESSLSGYPGIHFTAFPPQRRSVRWITDKNHLASYNDGSVLASENNNFVIIALPDLAVSLLKSGSNLDSVPFNFVRTILLHAFLGDKGSIYLNINGTSFSRGEFVSADLIPVEKMGLKNFNLIAVGPQKDTLRFSSEINPLSGSFQSQLIFNNPGEYTIFGEAEFPDHQMVYSSQSLIYIQDIKVEMRELIQDENTLKFIAHKTRGTYTPIESLDSMFAHIDITPVHLTKDHQISGLSSQKYWWLTIILLSIEWYFRKKIGLL